MKIYTSYYGNIKKIKGQTMFFVNIAGYAPQWFKNSNAYNFASIPELAPRKDWWQEWHIKFSKNPDSDESVKWYTEKYLSTVLYKMQPYEIVDRLRTICSDDDATFILLCYETPDKFCHRQIVKEWFNQHEWSKKMNIHVDEWGEKDVEKKQ